MASSSFDTGEQPEMQHDSGREPSLEAEAQSILRLYPERRSAIMPLLHACQDRRGYLVAEDIERVAQWIGETPAYVESVASFYVLYRRKPHGKVCLTVCTNLSCHVNGADELLAGLSDKLGIAPGETTPDGVFYLEETSECLAACDGAPMLQANLEYHLRVTPEKLDELLAKLRQQAAENTQPGLGNEKARAETATAGNQQGGAGT